MGCTQLPASLHPSCTCPWIIDMIEVHCCIVTTSKRIWRRRTLLKRPAISCYWLIDSATYMLIEIRASVMKFLFVSNIIVMQSSVVCMCSYEIVTSSNNIHDKLQPQVIVCLWLSWNYAWLLLLGPPPDTCLWIELIVLSVRLSGDVVCLNSLGTC